ncbi:PAAR domain-containing protein [Providencia sp. Me31A]
MPTIILIGDSDTGHGKHGPTQLITGSPTVKIVARQATSRWLLKSYPTR